MLGSAAPSLADIAAVTGNNRNNNDGWGDGGWWAWIILLALFGWGGNGFGFGNGGGNGTTTAIDASLQRGFDNQNVLNKLDGISNGICSLGYDQQAQMNGLNTTIMQTGFGLQNAIQQDTIAGMQNTNALQAQLAQCCCENREAISQVRYDMATDTCALQNTMNNNTRDIIDSQNAGTRAILDYLCQEKIADLQSQNQELRLTASQIAQNQYLVSALRPSPTPAYVVPNPYANYGFYGNNGCGCSGYNAFGGCC